MIPTTGIQAADIISKSQNWWEIPSCHILYSTFFFFFTVIYFDCCTWRISISYHISFRTRWTIQHKNNGRQAHHGEGGDRVFCLQNTSHDLHIWSRRFLSKTRREQEMRRVQRLKRLQQLWLRWDALSEKNAGYADAFFFFYRGGISLINSWIRKQLLPCYQFLLSVQFITQKFVHNEKGKHLGDISRPLFLFCTQFGLVRNKSWLIFLILQVLKEG